MVVWVSSGLIKYGEGTARGEWNQQLLTVYVYQGVMKSLVPIQVCFRPFRRHMAIKN